MENTIVYLVLLVIILILIISNNEHKRKLKKVMQILHHKEEFIKNEAKILEANGEYFVDGDAKPLEIEGYTAVFHNRNGLWRFSFDRILPLKKDGLISGNQINQLVKKKALNGNLIDFLLQHNEFLTDDLPDVLHCFGTIYARQEDNKLFVRVLLKCGGCHYSASLRPLNTSFKHKEILVLK